MKKPQFRGDPRNDDDLLKYEQEVLAWEDAQQLSKAAREEPKNPLVGIFDEALDGEPRFVEGPTGPGGPPGPAGADGATGPEGPEGPTNPDLMERTVYDVASVEEQLTGVTAAQTLSNKTLTAPTVGDLTNMQHDHTDAASGGAIAGGSGDMTAAVYDPAAITEQLVGLTAAQTLSAKTLTDPIISDFLDIDSTDGGHAAEVMYGSWQGAQAAITDAWVGLGGGVSGIANIEARGTADDVSLYVQSKGLGKVFVDAGGDVDITAEDDVNIISTDGSIFIDAGGPSTLDKVVLTTGEFTVDAFNLFFTATGNLIMSNAGAFGDVILRSDNADAFLRSNLTTGTTRVTGHIVNLTATDDITIDAVAGFLHLQADEDVDVISDTQDVNITATAGDVNIQGSPYVPGMAGVYIDTYGPPTDQNIDSGPITVDVDTTRLESDAGDWTVSATGEITLDGPGGDFRVNYTTEAHKTGGGSDPDWEMWLEVDTGAGFVEPPSTRLANHVMSGDDVGMSSSVILALATGDVIRLQANKVSGGTTTVVNEDRCRLSLNRVG